MSGNRPADQRTSPWTPTALPVRIGPISTEIPRVHLTSFVGREREIEAVIDLLQRRDVRLITLTGTGGIGKTRLALQVAERVRSQFADGVRFVPLATAHDPDLVILTIANHLSLRDTADHPLIDRLRGYLGDRDLLLVLDNFEHLLDAALPVADLLETCPRLTVVCTSRIRLGISGEHVVTVPPLAVPEDDHLQQAEAIQLFAQRASASSSSFALTEDNLQEVTDLCRRLDGLPLAIELAAARTSVLTPRAMLARIEHRLDLLSDGPRDAPARLRDMRDTIAWSYDWLTEQEQIVFRRVAVFSGGFTLDAAATVANRVPDILGTIMPLVAKSMLVPVAGSDDTPRFTMLETLREYGTEQLLTAGDDADTRARHAMYFLELAEQTDWCWFMSLEEGERMLDRQASEASNMRAALRWFQRQGDYASVMRMASMLGALWVVSGHTQEGRYWLELALEHGSEVSDSLRGKALAVLSWTVNMQGHTERAVDLAEEGLRIFRSRDEPLNTAQSLVLSAIPACRIGQYDHAIERFDEARDILEKLDEPDWARNFMITLLAEMGMIALTRGDIARSEKYFQVALERQLERGVPPGHSHMYGHLVLAGLGDIARARGDPVTAFHFYRDCLALGWRYHNTRALAYGLGAIAGAMAALSRHSTAARLFGASESIHAAFGFPFNADTLDRQRALGLPEPWAREGEPIVVYQNLHRSLSRRPALPPIADPDAATREWEAGRLLAPDDAVAEALALRIDTPLSTLEEDFGLTSRELEVLRHLVEGKSDRAIADALFISQRTSATHVRHIYDKLRVSSRAAAAAFAVRHGLS
jgi:non-specific serine/threonine protein kinase